MSLVVRAGLLIDGTGAPPVTGGVVVIEGSTIAAVGSAGGTEVPEGAEIIDCGNDAVMPGMIDSHTHVGFNTERGEDLYTQAKAGPIRQAVRAVRNLGQDLAAGVTTMRALGEPTPLDLEIRDAISAGEMQGPRLVAAGRPLRPAHGSGGPIGYRVDGVEGLRHAVRENVFMGVDVIKVFATNIARGDNTVAYRDGDLTEVPAYTRDELAVIVDEAHSAGIRVAAHAIGGPAMRWALEVGVDSVEHANLIVEDDVDWFLRSGAWLSDPNLQLFLDPERRTDLRPDNRKLPPWWAEKVALSRERTVRVLPLAMKAGVKVALGTDCNHGQLWREVACLVRLGVAPMDAIIAATRSVAELCGMGEQVGTLEAGKRADLICVKGNPLQDIETIRNVRLVIKDGKVVVGP